MEAVLMKQVEHKNIVPFYGVSTTASDFGLVFPWYKNGNIVDYLKENPDVDRYILASILSQPHSFCAYYTLTTVIRCGEGAAVPAYKLHSSWRSATRT